MSTGFVFGVVNDEDESLKGKSGGGKFGLNVGNLVKIEFLDDAGKDKSPGNAVDIWFKVGEREYRRRLYETTGELYGKKNTRVAPGEDGYAELYNADMTQKMAVINHAVKAVGVTGEQIAKVLATPATNFTEWCQKVLSLVPADFATKPVDGFLEYQWEIAEDQDRTYPELPKNMKGGAFLKPHVKPVGEWKEELTWTTGTGDDVENHEGLRYVDNGGNVHPFDRSKDFMESAKGTPQGVGAPTKAGNALNNAVATDDAKKSTW